MKILNSWFCISGIELGTIKLKAQLSDHLTTRLKVTLPHLDGNMSVHKVLNQCYLFLRLIRFFHY